MLKVLEAKIEADTITVSLQRADGEALRFVQYRTTEQKHLHDDVYPEGHAKAGQVRKATGLVLIAEESDQQFTDRFQRRVAEWAGEAEADGLWPLVVKFLRAQAARFA